MYIFVLNLNNFFAEQLQTLDCDEDTKAYIVSIFDKFKTASVDYSKDSITVLYSNARISQDFISFDNIGSWIFFCDVLFPQHLNNASKEYYYTIGQLSYYSCYRLLQRQWKLYEELSDNFPYLAKQTKYLIIQKH